MVASYHVRGRDVDVVAVIDDNVAWFQLVIDGELLPADVQLERPPTRDEAAVLVDEWSHSQQAPLRTR